MYFVAAEQHYKTVSHELSISFAFTHFDVFPFFFGGYSFHSWESSSFLPMCPFVAAAPHPTFHCVPSSRRCRCCCCYCCFVLLWLIRSGRRGSLSLLQIRPESIPVGQRSEKTQRSILPRFRYGATDFQRFSLSMDRATPFLSTLLAIFFPLLSLYP